VNLPNAKHKIWLSSHSNLPNVLQMQTGQMQSLQHVAGWPSPSLDQWLVPGAEHPALLHEPVSLKTHTHTHTIDKHSGERHEYKLCMHPTTALNSISRYQDTFFQDTNLFCFILAIAKAKFLIFI